MFFRYVDGLCNPVNYHFYWFSKCFQSSAFNLLEIIEFCGAIISVFGFSIGVNPISV